MHPRFEIHEKVNIAGGTAFPAGNRAKDADVPGSVASGQCQDGGTLFGLEHFEGHVSLILMCSKLGSLTR